MSYRVFQGVVALLGVVGLLGCEAISGLRAEKESPGQVVSLSDLSAPARATVDRLTAGGQIKKIEKEEKEGGVIYDVEARVMDKDVEYDVAGDGRVLTSEEGVPYVSLPRSVQMATAKYFSSIQGLNASKEVEGNKTFYEVEGKKGGRTITLKLTEAGRIVEEEKAR